MNRRKLLVVSLVLVCRGVPAAYLAHSDKGHSFVRCATRLSFCAVAEEFLAWHLRGHAESICDAWCGASLQVVAGVGEMPELAEALAEKNDGH